MIRFKDAHDDEDPQQGGGDEQEPQSEDVSKGKHFTTQERKILQRALGENLTRLTNDMIKRA